MIVIFYYQVMLTFHQLMMSLLDIINYLQLGEHSHQVNNIIGEFIVPIGIKINYHPLLLHLMVSQTYSDLF